MEKNSLDEKSVQQFLKYHQFVRLVVYETAPFPSLIDDMVNDVFLIFIKKAKEIEIQSPKAYLRQISRNVAKRYRSRYFQELS